MPPDIVLLLCDTARADALEPWGRHSVTPASNALAAEGRVFEQAVAQAPWTLASMASIFSGRLPTEHGITGECFHWTEGRPSSPAEAVRSYRGDWLPEALRARGYRTWGASCNAWISPWGGFDRGFDSFANLHNRARMPSGRFERAAWKINRLAGGVDRGGRQCLEEFGRLMRDPGPAPVFAYIDLMEVHSPYSPPRGFYPFKPWTRERMRNLTVGTTRFLSYNARVSQPPAGYVATIRTLYYHAARYADWLIGEFVGVMKTAGRPTVVVVVSDHGENLGEHGLFHHNASLHETLLHVPLLVWGQGVDVGADPVHEPVSLQALLPWTLGLADDRPDPIVANGPVISEYESASRHNGIPEEVLRRIREVDPAELPPLLLHPGVSLREGSQKYVAVEGEPDQLFDLADDPGEERNLLARYPGQAASFSGHVEAWRARRSSAPDYGPGETAEGEIAEHLSMLGYIE